MIGIAKLLETRRTTPKPNVTLNVIPGWRTSLSGLSHTQRPHTVVCKATADSCACPLASVEVCALAIGATMKISIRTTFVFLKSKKVALLIAILQMTRP
jgi:hypothetical protein